MAVVGASAEPKRAGAMLDVIDASVDSVMWLPSSPC